MNNPMTCTVHKNAEPVASLVPKSAMFLRTPNVCEPDLKVYTRAQCIPLSTEVTMIPKNAEQ